jgi:light-regulated signal transduction histidine kinase (bacteriophytochrome)
VTYTPDRDEAGIIHGMVVHVADIGERIKTEKALKHYAEQLHRSNKELEEFAFVVSHDLKEPLRKIEKFGGQIYSRAAHRLPEEERDYLKRMISAAERMRKMIEDLLSLSRVTSSRQPFVDVDLNQMLKTVLEDLEVSIVQSHAEIILNDLPVVKADPLQMQLLMQNLIVNGLKFHKPGEPPRITIAAHSLGGGSQFEIVVEDCGIGFDMHHAHKLFQPFQRLHGRSEYEGSGIGLAICRKIAERHSGYISASSQPGVGTRFTVHLPTDPAPLPG